MNANDAMEIARLAALEHLDYARERKAAAKALGINVGDLDILVKQGRTALGLGTGTAPGTPLTLTEIQPWATVVDGVELIDRLMSTVSRFVVIGDFEKLIVSLWVVHCYVIDACSISPRLAITSVFPESGKTTLLKLMRLLVPRPLHLVSLSGPTLFRTIECWHPSLLLDETNNWLFGAAGSEAKGDLMAIIDAGHERGVVVPRLVPNGQGQWEPHGFDVFGPMALALIGKLPEQIDSRSIEIACTRRSLDQHIEPLHARRPPPELAELASMAARWGADHCEMLGDWEPKIPNEIGNRTADNWEILFSISDVVEAEAVGPNSQLDYPGLARDAAIASGKTSKANRMSSNIRLTLLTDLKWLFESEWQIDQHPHNPRPLFKSFDEVEMFSKSICEALAELEDKPWAEFGKGKKPLTVTQLARLLDRLDIKPHNVRIGPDQAKGYVAKQFEKAWKTYL